MDSEPARLPPAIDVLDLRPDAKRLQMAGGPTGDVEGSAARVISRLTGKQVVIQDDGKAFQKPDLRIEYTDGVSAVVEVVVDMDPEYAATYSNLLRRGGQLPAIVNLDDTGRMWWVDVVSGAHISTLLERIAGAVKRLVERLGEDVPEIITPLDELPQADSPEVEELRSLGVDELGSRRLQPAEEAVVYIRAPGIYGPSEITWTEWLEWVEEYLKGPKTKDVREKLIRSGAEERHAFIAASFTSPWAAYYGLAGALPDLPPEAPTLPPEVTHLWLWTVPPTGRCLAWWPDLGWFEPRHHWATQ